MSNELERAREKKAKAEAGQAILDALGGPTVEYIAQLTDSAPAEIGQAMVEAVERAKAYREFDAHRAALLEEQTGIKPDECHNAVCKHHVPMGHLHLVDEKGMSYEVEDPATHPRCGGRSSATGCIFRMLEDPPSDPFINIPSHAEAVRMLQRAGLLKPDDFGKWNGTDFAFRGAVSKLWWAFVRLLVETGKIERSMLTLDDGEQVEDTGAQVNAALDYVGLERRPR